MATETPVPTTAHHAGSGSPMVLLHGINSSWRAWQGLFPRLEAEHSPPGGAASP